MGVPRASIARFGLSRISNHANRTSFASEYFGLRTMISNGDARRMFYWTQPTQ